jgi:hypothetical protein
MQNINGIIALIRIVLYIWLLILTFKIIFLFRREKVFEELNVKRCAKIGVLCLIIGLFEMFISISNTLMVRKVVELKFYDISFGQSVPWLIVIGLVIIIFTEILRISTSIKQEQDLTI